MRRQLGIYIDDWTSVTFPVVGGVQPITVREFTTVRLTDDLGKLGAGTELSGRLLFGQEHVYGRFTQARYRGQTYKVCIELRNRQGELGVKIMRDAGPDSAVVSSTQTVIAVDHFE
jgi:hypothetical protein